MWGNGLKWMFLIVGTIIGAGYASGRELWEFFGAESGLAIVLFAILFSISCAVILTVSKKEQTTHYLPVLEKVLGKRLAKAYDVMIILYLFSVTVIMLAGAGATLEVYHIPTWLGIIVNGFLVVLIFIKGTSGMTKINALLIPILIVCLLAVLLVYQQSIGFTFSFNLQEQKNWPASLTFTSLNILPIIAVLGAVGNQIHHRGEIYIASIGSGVILGTVSYIYNESLLTVAQEIIFYEIPLFVILKHYPSVMVVAISLVLWLAIYTTAASGVLGLLSRIQVKVTGEPWVIALLLVALMAPLTLFGFSTLISILYPLYGILNLYILAALLLYPILRHPATKKKH
ncbi:MULTISPECIES: YkvI family membrane protein [Bacillaceae]|uniref:Membrane protein YkvI n=1 Tax=Alkalicoccobacillus plakortidis TaxID=444060 RepID=A0A9D5DU97_9BACI|nr:MULTISPECIES: hypothetical protein [Bacillaceae]KQL57287.1 hypothetical protein AN965_07140 [Alkalicoccobacillus plakortidis]